MLSSKNITSGKIIGLILAGLVVIVFGHRIIQEKFTQDEVAEFIPEKVALLNLEEYQEKKAYIYTTGQLESLEQLDIKSELSAKVKKVNFKIGDEVKRGQVILELDNSTLSAQLMQAQASLDKINAGATQEDIKIYESAVALAKADLEKTKDDNEQMISSYQTALQIAENNLDLGSEMLIDTLYSVQPVLNNALVETDNIIGVDNSLANDSFEEWLSVSNSSKLTEAEQTYRDAKKAKQEYDAVIANLDKNSSKQEINDAFNKAKQTVAIMKTHVLTVQQVLDSTVPVGNLSQTTLNGMKTIVSGLNTSIITIDTTLTNAAQGQDDSGNHLNSYKIAYDKAVKDLENAKINAENIIKIKEANYNQAVASLEKVKANPRDVDLASLQAVVSQTAAVYNKSIITAPFDGVISNMPFRTGEFVAAGQTVAGVVNQNGLQIKAYINQKERSSISDGNEALIEDSYTAIVSSIAPSIDSSTKKIEVILAVTDENVENLTIGQYANAKIFINNGQDTQKFIIPLSAVKVYQDKKTVFFINQDNLVQEKEIKVGEIFGDNIEVTEGLNIEDKIISSVAGLSIGEQVNVQ